LTDPSADTAPSGTETAQSPVVLVLADDLIWATRLVDAVTSAGGKARRARRLEGLDMAGLTHVIVDLTARAYNGVAAVQEVAGTGARIVAVGQHDDVALRRAAIDAGAERVYTYRALFEDGARTIAKWLAS
jgi:DNA-binding NarL/FixJ family response regulator